jgi:hypothetical protein
MYSGCVPVAEILELDTFPKSANIDIEQENVIQ